VDLLLDDNPSGMLDENDMPMPTVEPEDDAPVRRALENAPESSDGDSDDSEDEDMEMLMLARDDVTRPKRNPKSQVSSLARPRPLKQIDLASRLPVVQNPLIDTITPPHRILRSRPGRPVAVVEQGDDFPSPGTKARKTKERLFERDKSTPYTALEGTRARAYSERFK